MTTSKPHYQSMTCIIHLAIDHQYDNKRKVAMKFMKNKESFLNEINIRAQGHFDGRYVIDILDSFDGEKNETFHKSLIQKGFSNYPFMIVMPVGDRNLNEIVTNGELIDQKDLYFIRSAVEQITRDLEHLHSRGYIHGDLKPKNIIRSDGSFLLIDLDGGAQIGKEYSNFKISSAYAYWFHKLFYRLIFELVL